MRLISLVSVRFLGSVRGKKARKEEGFSTTQRKQWFIYLAWFPTHGPICWNGRRLESSSEGHLLCCSVQIPLPLGLPSLSSVTSVHNKDLPESCSR